MDAVTTHASSSYIALAHVPNSRANRSKVLLTSRSGERSHGRREPNTADTTSSPSTVSTSETTRGTSIVNSCIDDGRSPALHLDIPEEARSQRDLANIKTDDMLTLKSLRRGLKEHTLLTWPVNRGND